MVTDISILVALVMLVDRIPMPNQAVHRGRPKLYPDQLFLKALVIMIVRHLPKVNSLPAILEEPSPEMRRLRVLLTENGRYPNRRAFERRLKAVPESLLDQISCLGNYLLALIDPFKEGGHAVAINSTILLAYGGVWH